MSARRMLRRLVVPAAVAVGAAFATLTWIAPAQAAAGEVKVSIGGLTSGITAGRSDGFTVRAENDTSNALNGLHRVILVQMSGLAEDQVTIGGFFVQRSSAGPGQVRFDDPNGFDLTADGKRTSVTATYSIRFSQSAPPGQATVRAFVLRGNDQLGGDTDEIMVRAPGQQGGNGENTPTPTMTTLPPVTVPVPTDAVPDFTPGGGGVAGPEPDSLLSSASGIPSILYVLGGVLLLLGGGILWLLFRGPRGAAVEEEGEYEHPSPGGLGYPSPAARHGAPPRPGAAVAPTTVMPTVRDPRTPPPGVDPWAQTDRTQEFPRR